MCINRKNITQFTIKKTKVATKAKPTETMREADSSPQAPGLPMPNMDEEVMTSTIATITTGKGEQVSLTHSKNGMPQATVLNQIQTTQLAKTPSVTSMPILSEPLVANLSVHVLVNKLEDFIATCLNGCDPDVNVKLPDAQREILTFVDKVTGNKFDTWKLLSEACKRGIPGEADSMSTNVLTPNHPSMTHEQILSNLMSYKEQYDGEDNMTLNAVPNHLDVCKALGMSCEATYFNPTSSRQKS